MLKNLATILYYALAFITPLLMFPGTSEIFEFNKMLFLYLAACSVLFLWLLSSILTNKFIWIRTWMDIPILLFFLSQFLSALFSIDVHTSLFGYYGRFNGGLLSIIAYIIIFYGFIFLFNVSKRTTLLKISLLGSIVVILWGLPGKFGYDLSCLAFTGQFNNSCWTDQFRPAERLFSTLGQPNWLGAYLAIHFFIGLYFFVQTLEKKQTFYTFFFAIYLFFSYITVLFTRSRSSLLALVLGFSIFFIFFVRKKAVFLLFISFVLLTVLFKTGIQKIDKFVSPDYYKKIFSVAKQKEIKAKSSRQNRERLNITTSSDIRKIVWKGAVDLGLKYPILGTGVETFAYSYYFVRPKEHNLTSEWDYLYNKAHNEFLNYFAATGFFGLGTYLFIIASVVFYAWKKLKTQSSKFKTTTQNLKLPKQNNNGKIDQWNNAQFLTFCLLISYLTILVTNFFGFSTTTSNLFFFLIPAILFKGSASNDLEPNTGDKFSLAKISGIITASVIYFFLLLAILNYFLADVLYAQAENASRSGDYQKSVNLLNEALRLKSEHVYEDKLSYALANLSLAASFQNKSDIAGSLKNMSAVYNNRSLRASPKNVLYWKTKAKNDYLFYQINSNNNDLKDGINALSKAKALSPTDPKISYSLSIFYSLLFDETDNTAEKEILKNKSLREIEESTRLKPDYRDGHFLKAQLLKKYGQTDEARKTLQFILDKINPDDQEVKSELQK